MTRRNGWSAVSLHPVGSGTLAGGDIYGGGRGVSGPRPESSAVRQEINGTESLRIQFVKYVNGV